MLELEDAVARILETIPPATAETVLLAAAAGRVLYTPITSDVDLPLFDNSAMDGYAVRAHDVRTARADAPVRLRIVGKVAAGETFPGDFGAGECVRIFTGSPLPAGGDAVVMQEDTRLDASDPQSVLVLDAVKPWESIRLRGEDLKRGARLVDAGAALSAGKINLLAASGVSEVAVGRRPVVGLLATGSELSEPGSPLVPGRIYESNRFALASLIEAVGGRPQIFPLATDSLAATREALQQALQQCDLLVSTGGVSVGEFDFIKPAFEKIGGSLAFWKVAIRPGRPFVFGQFQTRRFFGLPGNPVSAFVTFLLLVRPAVLRFQGAAEVQLPRHPAVLADPIHNPGDRRHFVRVTVDQAGNVQSAGAQGSHVLASLAAANGLLDLPPRAVLPAGASISVLRFA